MYQPHNVDFREDSVLFHHHPPLYTPPPPSPRRIQVDFEEDGSGDGGYAKEMVGGGRWLCGQWVVYE